MLQICSGCGLDFETTQKENDFLSQINISVSSLCHNCRRRRRFAFRNERNLYRRKCDLTGESIVSFYQPESDYKIYSHDAWWSDKWDPLFYGWDFYFNRPFFEQFADLQKAVPRIGMVVHTCENSDYAPYSVLCKNCYMCVSCKESEDLFYCYQLNFSRNCADCSLCWHSELCYECLYCYDLYQSQNCKNCEASNNLIFCEECRGCSKCIGCKNLANKQHMILNKQATAEEFEKAAAELEKRSFSLKRQSQAGQLFRQLPHRNAHIINCENCSGDHLKNCKNAFSCFDCTDLEDCAYGQTCSGRMKDCLDFEYSPGGELLYNCLSAVGDYDAKFVLHSWEGKYLTYTDECFSCRYLFGCIGLKNKEYCILNKQYTKEEYEELIPRIITKMQADGEWGEFFPVPMSPFAYNETVAQEYFPLTKEEVLQRGWKWKDQKDEIPQVDRIIPAAKLPDSIDQIPDDILNWAIECEVTKRPFRIVKQELFFYRQMKLPIPHFHPDERHRRRMGLRNPRKLWKRKCAKCGKEIETTYSPERPEIVYCEECYLKEVY